VPCVTIVANTGTHNATPPRNTLATRTAVVQHTMAGRSTQHTPFFTANLPGRHPSKACHGHSSLGTSTRVHRLVHTALQPNSIHRWRTMLGFPQARCIVTRQSSACVWVSVSQGGSRETRAGVKVRDEPASTARFTAPCIVSSSVMGWSLTPLLAPKP